MCRYQCGNATNITSAKRHKFTKLRYYEREYTFPNDLHTTDIHNSFGSICIVWHLSKQIAHIAHHDHDHTLQITLFSCEFVVVVFYVFYLFHCHWHDLLVNKYVSHSASAVASYACRRFESCILFTMYLCRAIELKHPALDHVKCPLKWITRTWPDLLLGDHQILMYLWACVRKAIISVTFSYAYVSCHAIYDARQTIFVHLNVHCVSLHIFARIFLFYFYLRFYSFHHIYVCFFLSFYVETFCPLAYSDKSACSIASGGSSIGGNSTATLGNEYPSLTMSDDLPLDSICDIDFTTNYGKWLRRNASPHFFSSLPSKN